MVNQGKGSVGALNFPNLKRPEGCGKRGFLGTENQVRVQVHGPGGGGGVKVILGKSQRALPRQVT